MTIIKAAKNYKVPAENKPVDQPVEQPVEPTVETPVEEAPIEAPVESPVPDENISQDEEGI
jgi:hypothetical protein